MKQYMYFISDQEINEFLEWIFKKHIELKYYDKAKMWVRVTGGYFL
jgi:hypothetical protein